jgi:hypothetical protein
MVDRGGLFGTRSTFDLLTEATERGGEVQVPFESN